MTIGGASTGSSCSSWTQWDQGVHFVYFLFAPIIVPLYEWEIPFVRVVMLLSIVRTILFFAQQKMWPLSSSCDKIFDGVSYRNAPNGCLNWILGIDICIYMNKRMHSSGLCHRTIHLNNHSRPFCESMVRDQVKKPPNHPPCNTHSKKKKNSTTWSTI